MDYAFTHEGKNFTPNQTGVLDAQAHNAQLEAQELAKWAKQPDRHCVYIVKLPSGYWAAQTWTGKQLGLVIVRKSFRTNLSRNMVAVTIAGTNGAIYYGRYGADWSQLCRVRKAKS